MAERMGLSRNRGQVRHKYVQGATAGLFEYRSKVWSKKWHVVSVSSENTREKWSRRCLMRRKWG